MWSALTFAGPEPANLAGIIKKGSQLNVVGPQVRAEFTRINVPSSGLTHGASRPGSICRLTRLRMEINCRQRLPPFDGRGHPAGQEKKSKVVTNSYNLHFRFRLNLV